MTINPFVNIVVLNKILLVKKLHKSQLINKMVKHKMNNKNTFNHVNVINKGRENTRGENLGRMHENGPKQKKNLVNESP
jgi:hypothetical protein